MMDPVPDIEAAVQPTHDELARQSIVSMIRKHSAVELKTELDSDYRERIEPRLAREGKRPSHWREIERAMESEASYRFYSAVRYNAQEMCYQSVQDGIERALPDMIAIARDAAAGNPHGGSLRLDPGLEIPRYVSTLDTHLAPGAFHSEHTPDDVAQGAVVFLGGRVFGRAHALRRFEGPVARSIGHWLTLAFPDFMPRRLLDVGTTTGRNIFPYGEAFPGLEMHGIDVAAPQLRFGYAQSAHMGIPVHFSQQDAEHTDYPDGHFDLIVSSFFFHELPLAATKRVLAECYRLLAPGGMMVHMELPPEKMVDDYENFAWNWDTANNNEPGYSIYRAQDPLALCAAAGFDPALGFSTIIPDLATLGKDGFRKFMAGELAAPAHGAGGWYIFGCRKAG